MTPLLYEKLYPISTKDDNERTHKFRHDINFKIILRIMRKLMLFVEYLLYYKYSTFNVIFNAQLSFEIKLACCTF